MGTFARLMALFGLVVALCGCGDDTTTLPPHDMAIIPHDCGAICSGPPRDLASVPTD